MKLKQGSIGHDYTVISFNLPLNIEKRTENEKR